MNETQQTAPFLQLWSYLKRRRGSIFLATSFSVLNKLFDLMPPALIGFAIDVVVNPNDGFLSRFGVGGAREQLLLLAAITAVVWIFESVFEYLFELQWRGLAQQVQHDLRIEAYGHLQSQRYAYFEDKRSGDLLTILNEDINQLERFLNIGANDIIQILTSVIVIGGMYLVITPSIGWVAVLPIPFIIWGSLWFQKFLEPRYAKVRNSAGEIASHMANTIQGMVTIKSFGTEELEARRVEQLSEDYRLANVSTIKFSSAFTPLIRMLILGGFIAILLMAGNRAIDGALAVGVYSTLVYIIQRLLWPLTSLGQTFDLYQRAMASVRRIMSVLEADEQMPDGTIPLEFPTDSTLDHQPGNIAIKDLHFSYSDGPEIIRGLTLDIQKGWTVGIVGATGAGKTSLIKLLLRLYDPTSGSILLEERDIRQYRLKDLNAAIALVSQDVFLFHGTARENIRYGNPSASDRDIEEAARLAEAHEFITELPQGYDTIVGERGQKLSGGQRQRISIARALVKNAPILILDEATSSVDNETEAAIQKSLSRIAHNRTSIVIAHRLSTIRHADCIFVLDKGQLAETGTHDALLELDGIYAGLWRVQSGEIGQ